MFRLRSSLRLLLLVPSLCAAVVWKLCRDDPYPVSVANVSLTPDPAERGHVVTMAMDAASSLSVAGGAMGVAVSRKGTHVYTLSVDVCDVLTCDAEPGSLPISYALGIPRITPPVRGIAFAHARLGQRATAYAQVLRTPHRTVRGVCSSFRTRVATTCSSLHPSRQMARLSFASSSSW